jgi:probable rRNA maturation factor
MLTDTILDDDRWADLPALAEAAATAALRGLGLAPEGFQIAILGCDDARIAVLNADFRDKPQPTNVLSWPSEDRDPHDLPEGDAADPEELGDIAIAYDTCAAEAAAQGKPFADHVTHLIVHATLHLLGHDHIDDAEAAEMEELEVRILDTLGIPDPY